MKIIMVFLLLLAILPACNKEKIRGSGEVISQPRNVSGFAGIAVNGSTGSFITVGSGYAVTIKGYENLLPYYKTNVESGVLFAGFKNLTNISNDNTELYVTMPLLNFVETNGSGDVMINGEIADSNQFVAVINGSANININGGNAGSFLGEINGSGNISAAGLQCQNARIIIAGNGDVYISVSGKLDVSISGNGNVYYRGYPSVTTHISGKGQVIHK